MEPLFFKAENSERNLTQPQIGQLQWSRFFSKRKIGRARAGQGAGQGASMEPLFFKAENRRHDDDNDDNAEASMEPLFFKAENRAEGEFLLPRFPLASMEPLFFKAENIPPAATAACARCASMEPLFFKAENAADSNHD